MQFDVIFAPETLLLYAHGIVTTLELLVMSLFFGMIFALPLSILRSSDKPWLWGPVWLFTFAIRGTPLLVQVYLIYYGVGQLPWVEARWDSIWPWTWFKGPLFCTVLAFVINTTAYTIEIIAGAIRTTPHGEIEGGRSVGMSEAMLYRRILLPSALRRALPAYSNEVILMLQATSVASVVPSLIDITGAAGSVYSTYYLPFEAYLTAGAIYLLLTLGLVALFRLAERRWLAYLRVRGT
jgi:arginine/ornithine transport system permease protein